MRAAIVLAAGSSRRFGRRNKLLAPLGGRPLLAHALAAARASRPVRLIVVTGADAARVRAVARRFGAVTVHARNHREGVGASLRAGLAALRPIERELLVYLGDMPFVPDARRWRIGAGRDAVRPVSGGTPGHPVLLRRPVREVIAKLHGDRGLGPLLGRVRLVRTSRARLLDVDQAIDFAGTIAGLSRLGGRWKR